MAHDPVVAEATRLRDSLEPRFVLDDQERRADADADRAFAGRTGDGPIS